MALDRTTVQKVARLARMGVEESALDGLAGELSNIIGWVEALSEVDTEGVEPTSHVLPLANAFRPDEVDPSPAVADILAAAPQRQENYFKVPRIID